MLEKSPTSNLSQMLVYQTRRPWTKTRMSAMAIRVRTRDSKTQDGENDVLRSTDLDLKYLSGVKK